MGFTADFNTKEMLGYDYSPVMEEDENQMFNEALQKAMEQIAESLNDSESDEVGTRMGSGDSSGTPPAETTPGSQIISLREDDIPTLLHSLTSLEPTDYERQQQLCEIQAEKLKEALRCIKKGKIADHLDDYFSPDIVLSTPTATDPEKIPYAGTFHGHDGVKEFSQLLLNAWGTIRKYEPKSAAASNDTGFCEVDVEVVIRKSGRLYRACESVTASFSGTAITNLSFFINVQGAADSFLPRKTPDDCPCRHNSWDNVRAKNGSATLRCRICQVQWKTTLSELPRCRDFIKGTCTLGAECSEVHVHGRKESLNERVARFGPGVLNTIPTIHAPIVPVSVSVGMKPLNVHAAPFVPADR